MEKSGFRSEPLLQKGQESNDIVTSLLLDRLDRANIFFCKNKRSLSDAPGDINGDSPLLGHGLASQDLNFEPQL